MQTGGVLVGRECSNIASDSERASVPILHGNGPSPGVERMTVLCAGMFRSGSTWAYNVVKGCLRAADPARPVDSGYHEGDELVAAIGRADAAHRVFKFHLGTPAILDAIRTGHVDAVVYSRRDPMAALASCVDQFCSREQFAGYWTFEKAVEHIEDGLRLGDELAGLDQVLTVDLHADGESVSLDRIAAHIGVGLGRAQLDAVRAAFTFDEMRTRSIEIGTRAPEQLFRGINDPETLMHAGHVDKGVHRDWTSELSAEQVAYASRRLGRAVAHAG